VGEVNISHSFFRVLASSSLHRWLDDDIINAFGVCVERRMSLRPPIRSGVWLSTYVWPSVVGLATLTPRPTALVNHIAASMASRLDPHNCGRFVFPLHHPGSATKADHWTLCAVDGDVTLQILVMADILPPSSANTADLAAHAAGERRLAALVLWWVSLLASAVGASFVADEWMVTPSLPTLQRQVESDCGVFVAYWGEYHLGGGKVHATPALNTLAYRAFMKRTLVSTATAEALRVDQPYCAVAPAQPTVDSTNTDGGAVVAQPLPSPPLPLPRLAPPLAPSSAPPRASPAGCGGDGRHDAETDTDDEFTTVSGGDGGDSHDDDIDSGGKDADGRSGGAAVGVLHENKIHPGRAGVTQLNDICSLAGAPPPVEGRAHIWWRVQEKWEAVNGAVSSGEQRAWGVEAPGDLYLELRVSPRKNLVEYTISN